MVRTPQYNATTAVSPRVMCPELYQILHRMTDGHVEISNEGTGMTTGTTTIDTRGRPQITVVDAGEYYRIACPFCKDTQKRLWINHRFGQPGLDGRRMLFLACCFRNNCLEDWGNVKELEDRIFGFRNANVRDTPMLLSKHGTYTSDGPLRPVDPPGRCKYLRDLPAGHHAVQYMRGERGYDWDRINEYDLAYCEVPDSQYPSARNRIVFPIKMNGAMVGWQCRFIGDADWKTTGIPKYYSMPGMKKGRMLYGLDAAKDKPFVIVVEGPTDLHALGNVAVCILGSSLSQHQRLLLGTYWSQRPIVLMLDGGAAEIEKVKKMRDKLLIDLPKAQIVTALLPDGLDPGTMPREHARAFAYEEAARAGITLPRI